LLRVQFDVANYADIRQIGSLVTGPGYVLKGAVKI